MAKRKRLTPAQVEFLHAPQPPLETKSLSGFGAGAPPIAQVAGAASALAALQEVTAAMRAAVSEGRLIRRLPTNQIAIDYLTRDRMIADAEELGALVESLREHGQRTPIEVMELADGRFGLISGWRRMTALELLAQETGEDRFKTVLALLRKPGTASDAYVAMVEENEIRVGLSYYERARVVALAVREGVFPTEKIALQKLFATASRAKRSKIGSFLTIYHALDPVLRFPTQLSERLGLSLAKALGDGAGQGDGAQAGHNAAAEALRRRLEQKAAQTPEEEQAALTGALNQGPAGRAGQGPGQGATPVAKPAIPTPQEICPGVFLANEGGFLKPRLVLSGPKVDAGLQARLEVWLRDPS